MSSQDQSVAGWATTLMNSASRTATNLNLTGMAGLANIGLGGGAAATAATGQGSVRAAIAQAAQATGMDFSYLLAQARLESALDPKAHSRNSSAAGLYQFTNSTWLHSLRQHGSAIGLSDGATADPGNRAQLMALRNDPQAAAMMAAHLASDNAATLSARIGHTPDANELYLAHFLGPDGAVKFLTAKAADPSQSAAALMPKAAASNRSIFFDAGGNARSLGQVWDRLLTKMTVALQSEAQGDIQGAGAPGFASLAYGANAMGNFGTNTMPFVQDSVPYLMPEPVGATSDPRDDMGIGPIARQFAAIAGQDSAGAGNGAVSGNAHLTSGSMADTLRNAFDATSASTGSSTPDFVREAYGRLRAMGL